jgi:hypothetical protein
MDYIGIIYIWICILTQKSYVGLSKSSSIEATRNRINTPEKLLYNRWKGHIQQANYNPKDHFHFAIRKYGQENFRGKVLKTFYAKSLEDIKKIVDNEEQKMIQEMGTLVPNGYNLQLGGFSSSFHVETCKKMRTIKQAFLRTTEGQEWIQKCSETQLVYFQTEKGIEQAKHHGNHISNLYETNPDIKNKISNTLLEYFESPEGRIQIENQKKYLKKFYNTDEGKKLRNFLSQCAKKRWENTEYRSNHISKMIEYYAGEEGKKRRDDLRVKAVERLKDPEKRKNLSEKTKAYFDEIGRKEYICEVCDNKKFRDKTSYERHCSTKNHQQRVLGLSKEDAKAKIQAETSAKISKSNKVWAEKNENPRKGKTHTEEAKEKNRLAHLGKKVYKHIISI